jgi:FkbM family methyltransferase
MLSTMSLSSSLLRAWNSESSPVALRTKQFIASVLPDPLLVGLKKRYYIRLLRRDSDELMETDARALPRLLAPGDFVIDVGAFVGFYTNRLCRLVGPAGLVWSFEPTPQTFEILSATTARLGLTNTRLFPYAVSDAESAAVMEIPRFRGGGEAWWGAKIVSSGKKKSSRRRFEIRTKTLDSLLAQNDRPVTFIKIDAEYHEPHCIRGAAASIRRWHPAILIETLTSVDEPGSDLHALVEFLCGLGYSPYRFDGADFHLRQSGDKQQNLFFLCEHHLTPRSTGRRA